MAENWADWLLHHTIDEGTPQEKFVFQESGSHEQKIFTRNSCPAQLRNQLPPKRYTSGGKN